MARDKSLTRKKVLAAVDDILVRQGMADIGVNAIARRANIDKVLIYRYFGGLDQLLTAYAAEYSLTPTSIQSYDDRFNLQRDSDIKEIISNHIIGQLKEIRRRKVIQEITRGELFGNNILTNAQDAAREKLANELYGRLSLLREKYPQKDIEAFTALLCAGFTYLVLSSRTRESYMSIDLRSNFSWKRIEKLISDLVYTYFSDDQEPRAGRRLSRKSG
jgi:AcrR family transcriptional regulator